MQPFQFSDLPERGLKVIKFLNIVGLVMLYASMVSETGSKTNHSLFMRVYEEHEKLADRENMQNLLKIAANYISFQDLSTII